MNFTGVNWRWLPWLVLVIGLIAFAATRALHPVQGLGNPDIGGILYSADTLNAGLLPYKDTFDAKQPGSFFVVAGVFRISRSIAALQVAFAIWLLLGAPAIWIAARALYARAGASDGRRPHLAPALATSLYLILAGTFDLNYAAWMMVPYAWSFAMLAWGLASGRLVAHALAAAFAAFAYLFKAQAVVLAPLFVLLFLWARRRGLAAPSWRVPLAWLGGAVLALLPLFVLYAARGAVADLIGGLVPLSDASAYSAKRAAATTDLAALWKVPRQQVRTFFLPLSLGVATLFGLWRKRRDPDAASEPSIVPALLFYGASLLGCGIGGRRFFVHYLAQCVPAVVLVAAHPASFAWLAAKRSSFTSRRAVFTLSRLSALAVLVLALFSMGRIPFRKNALVDNPGSPVVEQTGSYIREHAAPGDTLLVWGWAGWGSYFYSGLRSPSPVFKILGQVTEYNDNTAFSKGTSIRFKPGPVADRLLADIESAPPAFIVRASPFFPGTRGDPLDEWPELKTLLDRDYRVATKYGHLTVYTRKRRRVKAPHE